MNLTYTWKVTGIKTRDEVNAEGETLQNAVVQTYWQKIGTDAEGNEGTFSGATPFTAKDVPSGEFVPLTELTEETVIGWIQAVVVGGYEEHVNGMIQKQIDDKTITDVKLPWAPEEPEVPEPEAPTEV
jgi:hypothetical protein